MNTITENMITEELLETAFSFDEYTELVDQLLQEERTTNDDNRPEMLDYTKMNVHRSQRWNKRGKLTDEIRSKLQNFSEDMIWLVITEGWCGDAAQSLPFINKMADASDKIELMLILRDQNPEIMDAFLTNGSRSIPKLVVLNTDTLEVLGEWGPRPLVAQEIYMAERADPEIENSKAVENLHLWYARDKGRALQQEFLQLLNEWASN